MTTRQKVDAIMRRVNGETVRNIAARYGISYQRLYQILTNIPSEPVPDGTFIPRPNFSNQYMKSMLTLYLNNAKDIEYEKAGGRKEDAVRIIQFIKQPRREGIDYPAYPAISQWMQKNGHTTTTLAKAIGVDPTLFGHNLLKHTHLRLDTAKKVSDFSGLTLYEIYDGVMTEEDRADIREIYHDKKGDRFNVKTTR